MSSPLPQLKKKRKPKPKPVPAIALSDQYHWALDVEYVNCYTLQGDPKPRPLLALGVYIKEYKGSRTEFNKPYRIGVRLTGNAEGCDNFEDAARTLVERVNKWHAQKNKGAPCDIEKIVNEHDALKEKFERCLKCSVHQLKADKTYRVQEY